MEIYSLLDTVKWFGLRKAYFETKHSISKVQDFFTDLGLIQTYKYQELIHYPISKKLISEFCGDITSQNLNSTQQFLGFGLLHYAFVRNTKPKNILCIGSRKGFIPAILALACKDNNHGVVDFVDAGFDESEPQKHWGGIGFWKTPEAKIHFDKISVQKYIRLHVMKTDDFAKKVKKNRKYQYIYIDGDHSYKGAKNDYTLFWPHLSTNGFMVFHDIQAKGKLDKGIFGVHKLWLELQKKNDTICFPFPEESGLGIVQKSSGKST